MTLTTTFPKPRRYVRLPVTGDLLVETCKHAQEPKTIRVVANALPDDARFVHAGHDHDGLLWIVIESESFAPVPEGATIPQWSDVRFEIVRDDQAVQP